MKVIRKDIEMICWFEKNETPHPIKFRIEDENSSNKTIKIHKVVKMDKERLAGNPIYVFTCQLLVNGSVRMSEIKYELGTCKWVLFKI